MAIKFTISNRLYGMVWISVFELSSFPFTGWNWVLASKCLALPWLSDIRLESNLALSFSLWIGDNSNISLVELLGELNVKKQESILPRVSTQQMLGDRGELKDMLVKLSLLPQRQEACLCNLAFYDRFPNISIFSYLLLSYPPLLRRMCHSFPVLN